MGYRPLTYILRRGAGAISIPRRHMRRSRSQTTRLPRRQSGCASPFTLAAVREASGQDQQKHARGDAATCRAHQQQREALDPDPVPVVEPEADIARCQRAQAAALGDPQLSSLEQSRKGLAVNVDLHSILTLGERNEHGVRGPPNVAAPGKFAVERDRGYKEQGQVQDREKKPNARGHRGPPSGTNVRHTAFPSVASTGPAPRA